ncbi:MAG: DUF2203 domain-containing protein [Candidatus Omnitrophica bacterium]|nr:DUF2203 domain-containing protein [Candidatus Omnitrophota bacterium]
MNENEVKVFTLEEANELLPLVTELLVRLQEKRDQIAEVEVQIDTHELVSARPANHPDPEFEKWMARHRRLVDQFYEVVDEIHSHGCFLKDVDLGLIDFYGVVDDHIVCLCWRLGEQGISFWHDVQDGYAGRRPLSED